MLPYILFYTAFSPASEICHLLYCHMPLSQVEFWNLPQPPATEPCHLTLSSCHWALWWSFTFNYKLPLIPATCLMSPAAEPCNHSPATATCHWTLPPKTVLLPLSPMVSLYLQLPPARCHLPPVTCRWALAPPTCHCHLPRPHVHVTYCWALPNATFHLPLPLFTCQTPPVTVT